MIAAVTNDVVTMEKIVALCKRRGFVFPSSEIYGGVGSTYDFGHYGVLLKGNVKGEWWRAMITERDDIVAIDSAILQHPRVWEASGHLEGFTDPLVDCKTCGKRYRADHLQELECGRKPSKHPGEADECDLTEARDFNLMFETTIGPVKESGSVAYLRPETAQGIFINFKNVLQFARKKPPFGIAQVGKSFRNEITPGNFIFRTREFEQMEMEFFVPPEEAQQWFEHWLAERERWYTTLGIRPDHLRLRAHDADELSHYSSGTSDVEYLFPFGWGELRRDRQPHRLRSAPAPARRADAEQVGRQRARKGHPGGRRSRLLTSEQARRTSTTRRRPALHPATSSSPPPVPIARRSPFSCDAYAEDSRRRRGRQRPRSRLRVVLRLHPTSGPDQGRECCRWSARTASPERARKRCYRRS